MNFKRCLCFFVLLICINLSARSEDSFIIRIDKEICNQQEINPLQKHLKEVELEAKQKCQHQLKFARLTKILAEVQKIKNAECDKIHISYTFECRYIYF